MSGLERVTSYSNIDSEARRRRRIEREQERRQDEQKNNEEEAVSSRFESLNYEIIDNDLYRVEEKETDHQVTYLL